MKKVVILLVFLSLIFVTACGKNDPLEDKTTRTVDDLLEGYVKSYTEADVEITKKIYPPFYVEYAKLLITKENLDKKLNEAKETYGDDFTIEYEIEEKVKLTDEELEELNNKMIKYFKAKEKASECYKYVGTITFKGSKKEKVESIKGLSYCSYDGSWYLLGA